MTTGYKSDVSKWGRGVPDAVIIVQREVGKTDYSISEQKAKKAKYPSVDWKYKYLHHHS